MEKFQKEGTYPFAYRFRKLYIIEFSLNDFHWIQWFHWIMTKSKNGMVTRNGTKLATCTLPVAVIKITFLALVLVRYLLPFSPVNCYLNRCIWVNLILAIVSGNVSANSYGVSLVTIPLLDLLIFQSIQWKSFRENSNVLWFYENYSVVPLHIIAFTICTLRQPLHTNQICLIQFL